MFAPKNEKDLLSSTSKGNKLAFRQLFNAYRSPVYSVALKMLKSAMLAEDVVQEVFITIWHNREKLPGIVSFKSYLFKITRNKVFDEFKKLDLETLNESALNDHLQTCEDTDFALREEQLEQLLKQNLSQLTKQQQTIYRLSREEGKTYREIAEELGISPMTVKTYMKHTLSFLRQHLSAHLEMYLLLILSSIAA